MAYSYMTAVSDGTLKTLPISFEYTEIKDVVVFIGAEKAAFGKDYSITNNIIHFTNTVQKDVKVTVERSSQKDSLRVSFVEGATFSRDNMDDALTQLLYLAQEASESSAIRVSPKGTLDMGGCRIINLAEPIEDDNGLTLGYAKRIEGGVIAEANKAIEAANRAEAVVGRVEDALVGVEGFGSRVAALEGGKLDKGGLIEDTITLKSHNKQFRAHPYMMNGRHIHDAYSEVGGGVTYNTALGGDIEGSFPLAGYANGVLSLSTHESPAYGHQLGFSNTGRIYHKMRSQESWASIYTTSNPPTPSAIGAVSSSNVVGKLSEGAIFEVYKSNNWSVRKSADGSMTQTIELDLGELKIPASGSLNLARIPPFLFAERFASIPTVSFSAVRTGNTVGGWEVLLGDVSADRIGQAWVNWTSSGTTTLIIKLTFHGEWATVDNILAGLPKAGGASTLEEPEFDEPPDTPQVLPYDPEI